MEDDFKTKIKIKIHIFQVFFETFIKFSFKRTYSVSLQRQSEYSKLQPDTSSVVSIFVSKFLHYFNPRVFIHVIRFAGKQWNENGLWIYLAFPGGVVYVSLSCLF